MPGCIATDIDPLVTTAFSNAGAWRSEMEAIVNTIEWKVRWCALDQYPGFQPR